MLLSPFFLFLYTKMIVFVNKRLLSCNVQYKREKACGMLWANISYALCSGLSSTFVSNLYQYINSNLLLTVLYNTNSILFKRATCVRLRKEKHVFINNTLTVTVAAWQLQLQYGNWSCSIIACIMCIRVYIVYCVCVCMFFKTCCS